MAQRDATVTLLRAKCSDQEWEAYPDELKSVLQAEVAKLREALRKYGRHAEGCRFIEYECGQTMCVATHGRPCTCGLLAALGPSESEGE